MNLERKIELLGEKIVEANNGFPSDFEGWRRNSEVVVRTVMGVDSPHVERLSAVRYTPSVLYPGMETSSYRPAGVRSAVAILVACQEELKLIAELNAEPGVDSSTSEVDSTPLGPIFIVHGRDATTKLSATRVVEALVGRPATILHEQPNGGKTIIEKFEHAAGEAGFALVLLTEDDLGRAKGDESEKPRARQNVVFELGFFFGALGRQRTAVLYDQGVELPNDINGLVYIANDEAGAWRAAVAKELQGAGYEVDWSALGRF